MGIIIDDDSTIIDNTTCSFEDIYQAAVDQDRTDMVNSLGASYIIKNDLILKNNATIIDKNKFITVEGTLIQIPKGCRLHLGELRSNGSTLNGCTLNAPNIYWKYGFGHKEKDNSGDLLLYGSTINIFGFWGFFEGSNRVEIIDCFVDGYGRISGGESKLKNIIFKRSHGRYGVLSPLGKLKVMENMSVYESTPYDVKNSDDVIKCALYHYPKYAGDLHIYFGEYDGYDHLAYLEDSPGTNDFILFGTKLHQGYKLYRESDNVDFYHKFKFSPILHTESGNTLMNADVYIEDNKGNLVFSGSSDKNGVIDTWLTYYQDLGKGNGGEILTPHKIKVVKDNLTLETELYIDDNMINFPMIITNTGTCDCVKEKTVEKYVNEARDAILDTLVMSHNSTRQKADELADDLRHILLSLDDEVEENHTIIESLTGNGRMIL